ncbi:hypothetical protein G5I_07068 [Acromyrmex echinatior]|uniref:Uncharacterized protein n=1 Tax=Acromyrmex echinatior TaxID=103372 RepID=F4WMT4_ACREC|nr:hypothetical protein G5I_07068 [Acromyrmex echinatior]
MKHPNRERQGDSRADMKIIPKQWRKKRKYYLMQDNLHNTLFIYHPFTQRRWKMKIQSGRESRLQLIRHDSKIDITDNLSIELSDCNIETASSKNKSLPNVPTFDNEEIVSNTSDGSSDRIFDTNTETNNNVYDSEKVCLIVSQKTLRVAFTMMHTIYRCHIFEEHDNV